MLKWWQTVCNAVQDLIGLGFDLSTSGYNSKYCSSVICKLAHLHSAIARTFNACLINVYGGVFRIRFVWSELIGLFACYLKKTNSLNCHISLINWNNALKMITISYDIALRCYYLKITAKVLIIGIAVSEANFLVSCAHLCMARKNFPAPSMRKCCDSDIFRVHQYANWYQCLHLTFRCTKGTSVQTWHRLVKQFRCSDRQPVLVMF